MKIFNIMLSKDLGGIQQAFIDYNNILNLANYKVLPIISRNAKISKYLNSTYLALPNLFSFDIFSIFKLAYYLIKEKPDFVICHGKRAIKFTINALRLVSIKPKIISVAHNERFDAVKNADYIFSINSKFIKDFTNKGFNKNRIFLVPNSINISQIKNTYKLPKNIPTIGVMARFVEKKGVDVFIESCKLLRDSGVNFNAVIAGDGGKYNQYKSLVKNYNLQDKVNFLGWINDKEKFYNNIDIFCLPSLEEPFGIVLLEAMKYAKPIVSTKTDGPLDIFTDNVDALLAEKGSPVALKDALKTVILDQELSNRIVSNSSKLLLEKFSYNALSNMIKNTLNKINNDI